MQDYQYFLEHEAGSLGAGPGQCLHHVWGLPHKGQECEVYILQGFLRQPLWRLPIQLLKIIKFGNGR